MVIINKYFPFIDESKEYGFTGINLFGFIFINKKYWDKQFDYQKKIDINHEKIHSAQGRELLWIGFYLIYFFEWLVRLFINGKDKAYEMISFEREAYENERNLDYKHKLFAQWRR